MTMEELIQQASTYLDAKDIETVKEAYRFADEAHKGQVRKSANPISFTQSKLPVFSFS